MSEEQTYQVQRCLVGMLSSFGAVGITLTDVEQMLRVAAAAVGLMIGLVTLYALLRKKR